jgi:SAM-dependent methyltransferase
VNSGANASTFADPAFRSSSDGFRIEPGSFRDRTARVFYLNGAVYRGLNARAWEEWQAISHTSFFQKALAEGRVIGTEPVDLASVPGPEPSVEWKGILRHHAIPFVSYPYEWCFGMLRDAALLQLELLAAALGEEITLKDASPFNLQWLGCRPVFIDVASFVRYHTGEPWIGYRQFCRMFLYPLLLQAYKQAPFQPWLRGRLDGIDAEECLALMSLRDRLRSGVFTHVWLQSRFQRHYRALQRDTKRELKTAGFTRTVIATNVSRLHKLVRALHWTPDADASGWSEYESLHHYEREDAVAKELFVEQALQARQRSLVWDLGCNTGRFSRMAERYADYVVAIDSDHASIERLYFGLKASGSTKVLPLVLDVTDPSPNLGWRGRERRAMLDRGRPDLVLSLALVHHLVITSNIPLEDVIQWFHDLGSEVVVEFPTRDDDMVQRLLRSKDQAYEDYRTEHFESCVTKYFELHRRLVLPSGRRIIYHLRPRG